MLWIDHIKNGLGSKYMGWVSITTFNQLFSITNIWAIFLKRFMGVK
jgi:hypothetical protein